MPAPEGLQGYLMAVRRITGAATVSAVIYSLLEPGSAVVLHEGEEEPVPELRTQDAAASFVSRADARGTEHNRSCDDAVLHCRASSAENGYLLRIPVSLFFATLAKERECETRLQRRKSAGAPSGGEDGFLWLGLRYTTGAPPPFLEWVRVGEQNALAETPVSAEDLLTWTLTLGGYLACQIHHLSYLEQDPISQLPGRVDFQACLRREQDKAVREQQPLGLLLVNPDEFGVVNQRLGRERGDAALREMARRLTNCLRRSDKVFRYGSAVFGVVLPNGSVSATNAAAEKLRHDLARQPFLDGAVRLAFSIGAAVYQPADENAPLDDVNDLLRRADQALNVAKLSGGGRSVLWKPDGTTTAVGSLDRLSGIFTADTEKDYRNMLLLWDTITVISSRPEPEGIASEFVERIGSTLKPARVGLFAGTEDETPQLLAANRDTANGQDRVTDRLDLVLSGEQRKLMAIACAHKRTERFQLPTAELASSEKRAKKGYTAYAVPLIARDKCLGCLYVDGPADSLALDSSDVIFLNALASQVAMALDRAALASRWKQEKEQESQRLREEVRELRQALTPARLVYRSSQMQSVLDTFSKVAPTDVTVLITGESGTGKEMLARALHEISNRRDRPLVTVDCGAIAHSLMEAELFGHVKGAYTGAQAASPGRIMQAEKGTLFLDEIGEVPLEVQAKLLRFLQEKEITPVGASRSRLVDVRIVAATNRDLHKEVAAGRFREDLYYRLRIVTVVAPPLRERPDDILPLAEYFLEKFADQYDKNIGHLSPAAETALLEYPWPGNVRELQHCVLQAVLMSDTEEISQSELALTSSVPKATVASPLQYASALITNIPRDRNRPGASQTERPYGAAFDSAKGSEDPLEELREALQHQVTIAFDNRNGGAVPLGRWLAEDLVLAADSVSNGTAKRASVVLGMAETTFRRRLDKVKRELQIGSSARSSAWSTMRPILSRLVAAPEVLAGKSIFEEARQMLLKEVVERVRHDGVLGSALMGVTAPTYRRWTAALKS
jgi:hydrogenase-4 transcriptional activator